jgi:hypothetical protein
MKVIKIILYLSICVFLYGCDSISGAVMSAYNINVPIEELYNDIMENNGFFKYEKIELEYDTTYNYYPSVSGRIEEPHYFIRVYVYGFHPIIEYIYSDKVYLYASAVYLNPPSDVQIFSAYKFNELKQFLIEKYNLADEDIIIKSDFYKNRAMPDFSSPPEVRRR